MISEFNKTHEKALPVMLDRLNMNYFEYMMLPVPVTRQLMKYEMKKLDNKVSMLPGGSI